MIELNEISVNIDDLLLDPNNPRFKQTLKTDKKILDEELEKVQEKTLKIFDTKSIPENEEEGLNVTNIKYLYESMKKIGYVPIDRVVIRPVKGSNKFLVIEGNRRISTAKKILREYDAGTSKPRERRELEPIINSFRKITCMLFDTSNLSQEQIEHKVSVILGIRHHGSLLEWDALPKAYNIYNEYMSEEPIVEEFKFDNLKINGVASRLSIGKTDDRTSLKTYIPYLQLKERFQDVKDSHFSLIQSGVTNRFLASSFFIMDGHSYRLDEESLLKMNDICQFSIRDSMPINRKKIIIEPKKFSLLGRLIDKKQRASEESVKSYANDLIKRVLK